MTRSGPPRSLISANTTLTTGAARCTQRRSFASLSARASAGRTSISLALHSTKVVRLGIRRRGAPARPYEPWWHSRRTEAGRRQLLGVLLSLVVLPHPV